jgi:phosphatidylglycerophosphatase A
VLQCPRKERDGLAQKARPADVRSLAEGRLRERGVSVDDIARLVLELQRPYVPDLDLARCRESVRRVLSKREVCNAILTGIALDVLAEGGLLPEPLQTMVRDDDGLYGIDEVLALAIVNVYGSIGFTNFGYLDKVKPGVVGVVHDGGSNGRVNTFLDDLVSAVAAAAASRIAHNDRSPSRGRRGPGRVRGDGAVALAAPVPEAADGGWAGAGGLGEPGR